MSEQDQRNTDGSESSVLNTPVSRRSVLATAAAVGGAGAQSAMAQEAPLPAPPSGDELAWTPGWRIKEMFAARQISPREYAEFVLARCAQHQDLGAYISVFPEHYRQEAARATEQMMSRSADLPPLHGLPVAFKDLVWTKDQRTTLGSLLYKDFVPDHDSVASEQIKRAGGIIYGKTNTPEFGMNRRSVNLVSREAVNPWDRKRTSGGSSGGAGVAAAAGLGPLHVGTDGGGSIRIPSSFNGVFGLHPSRGRVPDGAKLWGGGTAGIGPMCRDVRDAAMLFQHLACVDHRDYLSTSEPPRDYLGGLESGVAGLRIAWTPDHGRVTPEEEGVVRLAHEAARSFRAMGATYTEPTGWRLEDPHDELEREPEYSRRQLEASFRARDPNYVDVITWSQRLPREDYAKLSVYFRNRDVHPNEVDYAMSVTPEVRNRPRKSMNEVFRDIDLLCSPVIGRTAFRAGLDSMSPWPYTAYTFIVNASGYCAASVPAGFYQGMPVGLHIIGRPNEEHLVFRAARALERERPWAQHRPNLNAERTYRA